MARKVSKRFRAELSLEREKSSAWLAIIYVTNTSVDEGANPIERVELTKITAWKNASAGKRWIKAQVQGLTPRRSVKLIAGSDLNEKGKPMGFRGSVDFKVDA